MAEDEQAPPPRYAQSVHLEVPSILGHDRGSTSSEDLRGFQRTTLTASMKHLWRNFINRRSGTSSVISRFDKRNADPGFGLLNFFTLKLLCDVTISVGDVISDFAQGCSLISTGRASYGYITIAINWLPGLAACTHFISMHRNDRDCGRTVLYACLMVLFYPIVPLLSYLLMLWRKPKSFDPDRVDRKELENFHRAESQANIAHAIAGGIESPIQFLLQMWLIVNGKIPKPWEQTDVFTVTDWAGNQISIAATAMISMLFSIISMVKAIIEFNIYKVHIADIISGTKLLEFLEHMFDHLPFLAAATVFRMTSLLFLLTYINTYAFIPIGAFFWGSVLFGYKRFDLVKIPLWLISFVSIFFPVCFTISNITPRNRSNMVTLQYTTFKQQNFIAVLIYVPSLIVMAYLVNSNRAWAYSPNVIFSNLEFNVAVGVTMGMGLLSYVLSQSPKWHSPLITLLRMAGLINSDKPDSPGYRTKSPSSPKDNPALARQDTSRFEIDRMPNRLLTKGLLRVFGGAVVTLLLLTPAILTVFCLQSYKIPRQYLFHQNPRYPNETRIIQGVPLNSVRTFVSPGCMIPYQPHTSVTAETIDPHTARNLGSRCADKIIYRVEYDMWSNCTRSECYLKPTVPLAVIISDDTFRPSHSRATLEVPANWPKNVPLILVQSEDLDRIYGRGEFQRSRPGCTSNLCEIGISPVNQSIPQTEYLCDLSKCGGCLGCDKEPFIRPSGHIGGRQYRTVLCFWGTQRCYGYSNTQEVEAHCTSADVRESFCPREHSFGDREPFKYDSRVFYSKTMAAAHNECQNKKNIRSCDKGCKWSLGLDCKEIDDFDGKQFIQGRYCKLDEDCIIEEVRIANTSWICNSDWACSRQY